MIWLIPTDEIMKMKLLLENWRQYLKKNKAASHDYEITDGTHRFEAAKKLGLETIKAYVGIKNETPT